MSGTMQNSPRMARVFRREGYLRLAKALNEAKPRSDQGIDCHEQWKRDCLAIANMLADQSAMFDSRQFLQNCGALTK